MDGQFVKNVGQILNYGYYLKMIANALETFFLNIFLFDLYIFYCIPDLLIYATASEFFFFGNCFGNCIVGAV